MSCSRATVSAGIGVSCIHVFTTAQVAAAVTASGHAAEIQSLASEFPRTPSMAAVQGAGVGAGNWMVSGAASGPGGVGTGGHSTSAGAANGMGSMAGVSGTGMSGAGGHPSNTLGKRSASSRYFGNQQIFWGELPIFPTLLQIARPAPAAFRHPRAHSRLVRQGLHQKAVAHPGAPLIRDRGAGRVREPVGDQGRARVDAAEQAFWERSGLCGAGERGKAGDICSDETLYFLVITL